MRDGSRDPSRFKALARGLEPEPQAESQLPGRVHLTAVRVVRTEDAPIVRIADVQVRIVQSDMIEHVHELEGHGCSHPLPEQVEVLGNVQIHVPVRHAANLAARSATGVVAQDARPELVEGRVWIVEHIDTVSAVSDIAVDARVRCAVWDVDVVYGRSAASPFGAENRAIQRSAVLAFTE